MATNPLQHHDRWLKEIVDTIDDARTRTSYPYPRSVERKIRRVIVRTAKELIGKLLYDALAGKRLSDIEQKRWLRNNPTPKLVRNLETIIKRQREDIEALKCAVEVQKRFSASNTLRSAIDFLITAGPQGHYEAYDDHNYSCPLHPRASPEPNENSPCYCGYSIWKSAVDLVRRDFPARPNPEGAKDN